MQTYPLYFREKEAGQVTLRPEGGYTLVRAAMPGGETAICRAVLVGERGERMLGVMEPVGREMQISRRLYTRDVQALGPLLRGEVRIRGGLWQRTDHPARLISDPHLRTRLAQRRMAWWRREGELLHLALPMEEGKPFPLECCFCLARVERVEGRRCAVFLFDGEGRPIIKS